jgi:hypothetical protein
MNTYATFRNPCVFHAVSLSHCLSANSEYRGLSDAFFHAPFYNESAHDETSLDAIYRVVRGIALDNRYTYHSFSEFRTE